MSFNFLDQGFVPQDSYSRCLDRSVATDEYPYGYIGDEPPAGYANQGLIDKAYENDRLAREPLPWNKERKGKQRTY